MRYDTYYGKEQSSFGSVPRKHRPKRLSQVRNWLTSNEFPMMGVTHHQDVALEVAATRVVMDYMRPNHRDVLAVIVYVGYLPI